MECDAILKGGVFDEIRLDTSRSVGENLLTWAIKADYQQVRKAFGGNCKTMFPIKGVPVSGESEYSEAQFEQWKSEAAQGNAVAFAESDWMSVVSHVASPVTVSAWLECIKVRYGRNHSTGLIAWFDTPTGSEVAVFKVRYLPTSIDDHPPHIESNGFQIAGASTDYALTEGQEIPLAGVGVLLTRKGTSDITVLLNTNKGSVTLTDEGPPPPEEVFEPKDLKLAVTRELVSPAPGGARMWYRLRIEAPDRYYPRINRIKYTIFYRRWELRGMGCRPTAVDETREIDTYDPKNGFHVEYNRATDPVETVAKWTTAITAKVFMSTGQVWNCEWSNPEQPRLGMFGPGG